MNVFAEMLSKPEGIRDAVKKIQDYELSSSYEMSEYEELKSAGRLAKDLIALYNLLNVDSFDSGISFSQLKILRYRAESDYKIVSFVVVAGTLSYHGAPSPTSTHLQESFNILCPFYIHSLQFFHEKAKRAFEREQENAKDAVSSIRAMSGETGIATSATHFKKEADDHENSAKVWMLCTVGIAIFLILYAVGTLFLHKTPYLASSLKYETLQLALSKFLIFSVLAYMLFFSASNFRNHKHNAVVNRHRQNALMTHKALIEAVSDSNMREVIMVQAADCIFSPQTTGYTGTAGNEGVSSKSVIDLISKLSSKSANG